MTHFVVIHALMVPWYPKRSYRNPIGDVMMDINPWRYPRVVEVVEESYEAPFLMKNPLDPHFMA